MCESDEAAREETCVKLNRTSTFAVHHKRTRTLTVTEKLRNEVKEKKNTFTGEETQVVLFKT